MDCLGDAFVALLDDGGNILKHPPTLTGPDSLISVVGSSDDSLGDRLSRELGGGERGDDFVRRAARRLRLGRRRGRGISWRRGGMTTGELGGR